MYIEAAEGDSIDLTYNNVLRDASISVIAKIYSGSTQVGTNVSLSHVADGYYRASYTVPTGYQYLTAFYVPTDPAEVNSNALDIIKVRTLSPYGSGIGGGEIGLLEEDIQRIIDEINKNLRLQNVWKMLLTNGKTAEDELIGKSEFNPQNEMVKIPPIEFKDMWKMGLKNGRTAEDELIRKSEFNVKKDVVKIPNISFEEIKNYVKELIQNIPQDKEVISRLSVIQEKIGQMQNVDFQKISQEIQTINDSVLEGGKKSLETLSEMLRSLMNRDDVKKMQDILKEESKFLVTTWNNSKLATQKDVMEMAKENIKLAKQLSQLTEMIYKFDGIEKQRNEAIQNILEEIYKKLWSRIDISDEKSLMSLNNLMGGIKKLYPKEIIW